MAPWPRNERGPLVGLKTTSYADNVVALAWARERGAGEADLREHAGSAVRGHGSNVFVVLDGELLTPQLRVGVPGRNHPRPGAGVDGCDRG